MASTNNTYNGVNNETGPKTPEKDNKENSEVEKNDDLNASGDSQVQDGQDIVNEEQQNDIVNAEGSDTAEEYINSEANLRAGEKQTAPVDNTL